MVSAFSNITLTTPLTANICLKILVLIQSIKCLISDCLFNKLIFDFETMVENNPAADEFDSLGWISDNTTCPSCNSPAVEYEADDETEKIKFICTDCNWELLTSYKRCESFKLYPRGDRQKLEIILVNEEGEEVSKSERWV